MKIKTSTNLAAGNPVSPSIHVRQAPRFPTLLIGVVMLICAILPIPSSAQIHVAAGPATFRPDRIIVKPLDGDPLHTTLHTFHSLLGVRVLKVFPEIDHLQVIQVPAGDDVPALLAAYRKSGLVKYAEPDYLVKALSTPNDFRYQDGSLWNLHNTGIYGGVVGADIHAAEAWNIRYTATGVIVAVIDTGVRYTHEDLAINMWQNPGESGTWKPGINKSANRLDDDGDGYVDDVHGINAILGTGDPADDYGHGTHVSGIIGGVGNNTVGITGVAWRVPIMACKFINPQGEGSISDAITCISYARQKGAKIINASWGGYGFTSTALYEAIDSARQAGIIFVAAAGNDNNNNDVNPLYPACYNLDNIIAVAATDRTDHRAFFSNYGARTVALGAPGSPIFSCWNGSNSDYRYNDGTSMAAPHVAGACALVWARTPSLSYLDVIARVRSAVDPLPDLAGRCTSGGRLNLKKALTSTQLASVHRPSPVLPTGAPPLAVTSP